MRRTRLLKYELIKMLPTLSTNDICVKTIFMHFNDNETFKLCSVQVIPTCNKLFTYLGWKYVVLKLIGEYSSFRPNRTDSTIETLCPIS